MDGGVGADTPLDYAAIQIFPDQNRYEAFACSQKKIEKFAAGLLEHLLQHLPKVSDLNAKGSDAKFDLRLPESFHGAEWFSKPTFKRFLHIVGSPDLLSVINALLDEISQLDETKKFHLSLYGKDHLQNGKTDGSSSTGVAPTFKTEVKTASSDASKNELLRAMDLRLKALGKELAATINKAVGDTCSYKEIAYLEKFSQHFGATDVQYHLFRFLELSQNSHQLHEEKPLLTCDLTNDDANITDNVPQVSKAVGSVTPVEYGVSPVKVAEVERQSPTESEESGYSSDEGRTFAERSRTLIRFASPRRSASPMRRIQIGKSGLRKAAALTIKSLNSYPAREKWSSYRDVAVTRCEEDECEQPCKKTEIDVRRITVQDAICLFESKQKDHQTADNQKSRSTTDISLGTNKSVLRRWSAGMGEASAGCLPEIVSEDSVPTTSNDVADSEILKSSEGVKVASDVMSKTPHDDETTEVGIQPERQEKAGSYPVDVEADLNQGEEITNEFSASAEWNKQKEAELNQMLIKRMESKPTKFGKTQTSIIQNIPSDQKVGSYDRYKVRRDAKLRENTGKKADKEAQFRAMQQIPEKRKAEMVSSNVSVGKKPMTRKPQKSDMNISQSANSSSDTYKPLVTKKVSSKASTVPATRKSWSSTPSPRSMGPSPAKIPGRISSAGSMPTRWKPQQAASVPQPRPKKENFQQRQQNVKDTLTENVRTLKSENERQKPAVAGKRKDTKAKVAAASEEKTIHAKLSICNKGTKKSSVVPLEAKPFLRKGSGIGRGVGPINKKKDSPQLEESLSNSVNVIEDQDSGASTLVSQPLDRDIATQIYDDAVIEPEWQVNSHLQCGETEILDQVAPEEGNDLRNLAGASLKIESIAASSLKIESEEESTISPAAWVEIEEHLELPKPCEDSTSQPASLANSIPVVGLSSPRVRHSLSQMLQEENSEPDFCDWGNAENPPALVYQKDTPKGLKRLLKFARKSKGEANSSGWSSPSIFSEGEDDADESKTKRNVDNLLRKAALNAKNYGQQKSSLYESYERNSAQSNLSKFDDQSSHKMQESYDSVAGSTTKATRSFFSLSAFRGNKP
ncbi:serine/arginine repetitive matrix protein 2-like isoform X2 [Quillaja saponaria]|uniref:Serine/arginine repetitive matrix protein 2-like isoform X2 n=1 Tax=Quillaja saponaria TaxID=32244 RepID=A0AAD7LKE1_QUISA|nr:serine/arginine repetitive matrix protein 2-like isoform X2 [Quillaja saponaria]KAJ7959492.1 serine/arginine repetitive matrix protein 2-like isoform X2 [Quillaja saponaria]